MQYVVNTVNNICFNSSDRNTFSKFKRKLKNKNIKWVST